MIRLMPSRRHGPIGVDVGATSVKMVQCTADGSQLVDAARWDLPPGVEDFFEPARVPSLVEALTRVREGREFRGREVVIALNDRQLFMQNVRIPRLPNTELDRLVQHEASGRLPYDVAEAEIRYIKADDIRQGDQLLREVILLAARRKLLDAVVEAFDTAGLRPIAIDAEPCALLRGYAWQYRRDEDRQTRALMVHVGYTNTIALIARGHDLIFVKYLPAGGRHMDEAVARHLRMEVPEAAALRRHNGDRRVAQQDPEVARTVQEAVRPVVEQLASELAMCCRYHRVTFRGTPLSRLVLGGGEATGQLLEALEQRLHLPSELADPLRTFETRRPHGRVGQFDVALGLALRGAVRTESDARAPETASP